MREPAPGALRRAARLPLRVDQGSKVELFIRHKHHNLSGVTIDYEGAAKHSANVATLLQVAERGVQLPGFCISSSIDEKTGENATCYGSAYQNYNPFAEKK